jgi:Fungal Zn(2)-Cys(6) binuclear cluster domain
MIVRTEQPGRPESFSCFICRQRKVKCDRENPCSNCLKAAEKCTYIAPVRGKRRITKPAREGLHAKLRRYEQLLESHGLNPQVLVNGPASTQRTVSEADVEITDESETPTKPSAPGIQFEKSKPSLAVEDGASIYFEG